MKKFRFLAVMALVIMLGCTNEELTNVSIDENQLKTGRIATTAPFSFTGNSATSDDLFDGKCWVETTDEYNHPEWKLLLNGNFSGKIHGFGIINSDKSIYKFTECAKYQNVFSENAFYDYKYSYMLTAIGTLYIGKRGDSCAITISGRLYPFKPTTTGKIYANLRGTATFSDGTGRLKNLNGKTVNIFSNETSTDLSIGLLNLKITTSNF
jgi:hypothetical protein